MRTETIKQGDVANTRDFFRSMSDNARTDRVGSGQMSDTLLPIVDVIKETRSGIFKGEILEFKHSLKKAYEIFVRYRGEGITDYWKMAPSLIETDGTFGGSQWVYINKITDNSVFIEFFSNDASIFSAIEFEIYFVDFWV